MTRPWKDDHEPDVDRLAVVPCGRAKLDHRAPARHLYTGAHFQFVLRGVEHTGDRVLILSARHGLVDLDTVLAPYDTTIRDPGGVPAARIAGQLAALPGAGLLTIDAYLPRAYLTRLIDAITDLTRPCQVVDCYQGCHGIGEQRHVIANLVASLRPERT